MKKRQLSQAEVAYVPGAPPTSEKSCHNCSFMSRYSISPDKKSSECTIVENVNDENGYCQWWSPQSENRFRSAAKELFWFFLGLTRH